MTRAEDELRLSISRNDEVHLILALVQYKDTCRRNHVQCPPMVDRVVAQMSLRVTTGQAGSTFDTALTSSEPEDVSSLLVTYDAAAAMLSCSRSTIKRRARDGDLTPVPLGGRTVRLRRTDIETLIENGGL